MDDARTLIMRATGLDASELPYVAELMDVNEQNEQWRLAMNVAYAPIAQTILVDKRHEQGFAAKISAIDPNLMTRRTGGSSIPACDTIPPAVRAGCRRNCSIGRIRRSSDG